MNSMREALRDALGSSLPTVEVFASIDSTNSEAKRRAGVGETGPTLIVAEHQSRGRGRMGRSFFSPARSGAYFSILYTPHEGLADAVTVTCAASVAVMRAIYRVTGRQTSIKWVNDLYLDGKKVCGILAESVVQSGVAPRLILGIGINLSTVAFPSELEGRAGSLGVREDLRVPLIVAVWQELKPFLDDPTSRAWLEDYRRYSAVIGRPVQWGRDGVFCSGEAIGIDCDGGLEVRGADGKTEVLRTGEISVLLE